VSSFLGRLKCRNGKLAYSRALWVPCIGLWKQDYISGDGHNQDSVWNETERCPGYAE